MRKLDFVLQVGFLAAIPALLQAQDQPAPGPASPPALQDADEPDFNNTKTPLPDQDFILLNQIGYHVQPDGTIRAPGSARALKKSEIPLALDELTGRQRLQAMMQLNVVFNKYGTKNLPSDALEDVRRIGRQNWSVLPDRVRTDLRSYFSPRELEAMDSGLRPLRVPQTWLPLEAPGSYSVADSTIPETASAPQESAPAPTAVPASSPTVMESSHSFTVSPAEPPRLEDVEISSTAPAASIPPPPPPAASAPANAIEYPEMSRDAFNQFLAQAPYTPETKALLAMISDHAPAEARRPALGVVAKFLPLVSLDAPSAGQAAEASIVKLREGGDPVGQYRIALNPGPAKFVKKKFLSKNEFLLPDDPAYYQRLECPAQAVQSAMDSSERLRYSPEQLAGSLLKSLVELDARVRSPEANRYQASLLARSLQFLFYRAIRRDGGKEALLSPNLRVAYDEWLDRPEDDLDWALQAEVGTDSEGRQALDAAILQDAGLSPATRALPKAQPAPPQGLGEPAAASKQWTTAEEAFREELGHEKK